MALYYRVLGLAAVVNSVLGAIRIYHIPLNWLVLALLGWIIADGATRLGEKEPGGLFTHLPGPPVARVIVTSCAVILLVDCMIRKNLVFRSTASPMTGVATSSAANQEGPVPIDLRVSGRFGRGGVGGLWLTDFPAALDITETGTIELVTRVIEHGGFHGFHTFAEDRSGTWSLALPRESLTGDLEDGIVYFGLSARPALRLRIPAKPTPIVLSVGNAMELMAFHRTLDLVLAESALREAAFAGQLGWNTSPTPAGPAASAPIPEKNPGGRDRVGQPHRFLEVNAPMRSGETFVIPANGPRPACVRRRAARRNRPAPRPGCSPRHRRDQGPLGERRQGHRCRSGRGTPPA